VGESLVSAAQATACKNEKNKELRKRKEKKREEREMGSGLFRT
jgi:ribosomal protein L12E/L44/L45/RPP1/RPP2